MDQRTSRGFPTVTAAINSAWIGFVGVVVGAVVVALSTFVTERLRTAAAEAAEDRRERTEIKRASRIVDSELQRAEIATRGSLESHNWWVDDLELTTDGWFTCRSVIAARLSWPDWVSVLIAVQAVSDIRGRRTSATSIARAEMLADSTNRSMIESAERLGIDVVNPTPRMTDTSVASLQPVLKHLVAGREALKSLNSD
jgi:hypothetical protein